MKDVVIERITLELLGTIWEFIAWIIREQIIGFWCFLLNY